jgi:hypothetical protein
VREAVRKVAEMASSQSANKQPVEGYHDDGSRPAQSIAAAAAMAKKIVEAAAAAAQEQEEGEDESCSEEEGEHTDDDDDDDDDDHDGDERERDVLIYDSEEGELPPTPRPSLDSNASPLHDDTEANAAADGGDLPATDDDEEDIVSLPTSPLSDSNGDEGSDGMAKRHEPSIRKQFSVSNKQQVRSSCNFVHHFYSFAIVRP